MVRVNSEVGQMAKKLLGADEALAIIRKTVEASGLSHDKFGEKHGFNGEVVGLTLRGKREPAKSILAACGLRRVARYERVGREEAEANGVDQGSGSL